MRCTSLESRDYTDKRGRHQRLLPSDIGVDTSYETIDGVSIFVILALFSHWDGYASSIITYTPLTLRVQRRFFQSTDNP